MPIRVEQEKWILYKHTNSYEMVKAVAMDVKNQCGTNISEAERHRMQKRLEALNLYHTRNPKKKPLDAMNHRINTLEFFMFGYESEVQNDKRFIFSPLGNLFLKHIDEEEKLKKIFTAMLYAVQFQHYANNTPACIQLYPFRLILTLLADPRLDGKLYFAEYAYCLAGLQRITPSTYERLVASMLAFRELSRKDIAKIMKSNEHYYVNCVYEWQYYITTLLEQAGLFHRVEGNEICRLYHPTKANSQSRPTGRKLNDGFVTIQEDMVAFVTQMNRAYSCFAHPVLLSDEGRMQMDIVKEIYSFFPQELLHAIGEKDDVQMKLLQLPHLIEEYSNNEDGETAYLFEDVLAEGFDMFLDVETRKIGGAGHTDIECLYLTKRKKFAVEAKSTKNKLSQVNSGRLRSHRQQIGAAYTIVITPRYVPAVRSDIKGQRVVVLLANTFSEFLYNHICHDVRNIEYGDIDEIIEQHLGEDVSRYVSDWTIKKFSAPSSTKTPSAQRYVLWEDTGNRMVADVVYELEKC